MLICTVGRLHHHDGSYVVNDTGCSHGLICTQVRGVAARRECDDVSTVVVCCQVSVRAMMSGWLSTT